MRLTLTGKKNSAVTPSPLTDAMLALLLVVLLVLVPMLLAGVNLF